MYVPMWADMGFFLCVYVCPLACFSVCVQHETRVFLARGRGMGVGGVRVRACVCVCARARVCVVGGGGIFYTMSSSHRRLRVIHTL